MLKKVVVFLGVLIGTVAFAAEVRVTRFNPISENRRVAELCGVVIPAVPTVRAVVDYNSEFSSSYTLNVDSNGRFCAVVSSYYGRVIVLADEFQTYASFK